MRERRPDSNNGVSRIEGLLAVEVFGASFSGIFRSPLKRRLDRFDSVPRSFARCCG
jgi:hypothetical protein